MELFVRQDYFAGNTEGLDPELQNSIQSPFEG